MDLETKKRKCDFLNQLNLSKQTITNYKSALSSPFLEDICIKELGVKQVFEITDLSILWELYSKINLHPLNISKHRQYSAAIMKYMRFLNNGKRYGKRIDYKAKE